MSAGKRSILSAIATAAAFIAVGSGTAYADPESDQPTDISVVDHGASDYAEQPATDSVFERHMVDEEFAPGPVEAPDGEPTPVEGDPLVEEPAPEEDPVIVDDPIPGAAPSRPLVLVPEASTRPVISAAAIDKSNIVYTAHPVPHVTDADIFAGLQAAGVNPGLFRRFDAATRTIMGGESGGATNAVNRRDSNAWGARQSDGAPAGSSRGLMQTVPGTFAANHAPGTSTFIYDPVANIAAAWRYIAVRYHVDLHTGAGLVTFMARGVGHGVGY
ncbi:transglycosylase SLT domain-containing protein [Mycobacteroides abscessus]|uniref:transglycosylase SLT domain-containing protein n=1 Tax=Mycobacteroides abscessus TaxID=36809 RepID=UPI0005DEDD7F|nr:transglycosylase SLT domain-containing protein [Mycobacteroides abscessus]CPW53235.1 transglycosylase family protein [Mycobacteroides abscessus]SKF43202.1 transglycosylase family protein [Mycobacteroides abscessus subsp. bolletii]SKH17399.1 transglycosylase family protein [Mycobacteroides abscessus subsp. bolletii]